MTSASVDFYRKYGFVSVEMGTAISRRAGTLRAWTSTRLSYLHAFHPRDVRLEVYDRPTDRRRRRFSVYYIRRVYIYINCNTPCWNVVRVQR